MILSLFLSRAFASVRRAFSSVKEEICSLRRCLEALAEARLRARRSSALDDEVPAPEDMLGGCGRWGVGETKKEIGREGGKGREKRSGGCGGSRVQKRMRWDEEGCEMGKKCGRADGTEGREDGVAECGGVFKRVSGRVHVRAGRRRREGRDGKICRKLKRPPEESEMRTRFPPSFV